MEVTAKLNNYRQSPRKVRVVADVLRGKTVKDAEAKLSFVTKRAVSPLGKLLKSAIANAKDRGANIESLFVKSVEVNQGKILYRSQPAAHGSAHPIRKRVSNVSITLIEREGKKKAPKAEKKNKENKE